MENCLYSSGKLLQLWWKIVTTVVENCCNYSGKICYIVTNFSTTVVTIFPLVLAISFILLYETIITEKNEV